ncbi:hypothetical protein [Pedobacter sp. Leaf250]|uniref:hypothetical protein n=1 Tax=Pedobacter sp. Leaf250 TaxID=2876559 RepID=UPI00121F1A5A|nr:hypothetical protein [Pedobacter sp. Leaf250]RZJ68385.1 MAG: hypothetical protein EOO47_24690 [Flavobacterium sp.]
MNNKIKFAMVAFVAIISIAGCQKEINYNDPNGNNCKLSNLVLSLPGLGDFGLSFTYDASGKLIKAVSNDDTMNYAYFTNKITATDQDGKVREILLSNGRAVSSSAPDYIQINGMSYDIKRNYTFNAEGYLATVKNYVNSELNSTDVITYTNGNLTKSEVTFALGGDKETTVYEYSNALAVNTYEMADPMSTHVDYFPGKYYGIQSKNVLIKSTTTYSNPTNAAISSVMVTDHKYQFDAKGNATSISLDTKTYDDQSGKLVLIDEYLITNKLTYDCK